MALNQDPEPGVKLSAARSCQKPFGHPEQSKDLGILPVIMTFFDRTAPPK
jgi:hypothetical protein